MPVMINPIKKPSDIPEVTESAKIAKKPISFLGLSGGFVTKTINIITVLKRLKNKKPPTLTLESCKDGRMARLRPIKKVKNNLPKSLKASYKLPAKPPIIIVTVSLISIDCGNAQRFEAT